MTDKEITLVFITIYAICFVVAFLTTRAVNIQNGTDINLTDCFIVLCPVLNFFVILFNLSDLNLKSQILNRLFLMKKR